MRGLLSRIEAACGQERDIIWFHVASFGEFEEARPVIEATRRRFPARKILLTVFSPSVYEPMKQYDQVAITNDYWNYVIWHELDDDADFDTGYKELVQDITAQDVQQMAQRLMQSGYRIEVTMLSE